MPSIPPNVISSLFNLRPLADHFAEISALGITSVPDFLKKSARHEILAELANMQLTDAAPESDRYKVKQSYRFISTFQHDSLFQVVGTALQEHLNIELVGQAAGYLSEPLQFTDLTVQQYQPTPIGISPHRDEKRCINLIAVFVIEGKGRFCLCDDRDGSNPRVIRNEPGDLLLMRAPGWAGESIQPFHFVDTIEKKRTSFALRHDQSKTAG